MSETYVAWNGREYPWPPPHGWELRSDGRYWPVDQSSAAPTGGFAPTNASAPGQGPVYQRPENLPPPDPRDRVGPRPLRRRSLVALAAGTLLWVLAVQFIPMDILGFTVSQDDFVAFDDDDGFGVEVFDEPDFGEERELSVQSKEELLEVVECVNDGNGARMTGTVQNPIDAERMHLINVEFFVNDERQLDGFAEFPVPGGETVEFTARSASTPRAGEVSCRIGDVFRFIAN